MKERSARGLVRGAPIVQKLSFSPNCRFRGLNVPPAFPKSGLFKRLLPVGPTFGTPN